jgi:menaquinone-dependent protoporphyrinogen oxidase
MDRVGAQGHATFGGRLEENVKGYPASAIAKKHAGDWRDRGQVRRWANGVANTLTSAHAALA